MTGATSKMAAAMQRLDEATGGDEILQAAAHALLCNHEGEGGELTDELRDRAGSLTESELAGWGPPANASRATTDLLAALYGKEMAWLRGHWPDGINGPGNLLAVVSDTGPEDVWTWPVIWAVKDEDVDPDPYTSIPGQGIVEVRDHWRQRDEGPFPYSPLVKAWLFRPHRVDVETRPKRALAVHKKARLAGVAMTGAPDHSPQLPLFPAPERHHVPLLEMVDAAGVPVAQQGGGAALPMRLIANAMWAVKVEDRRLGRAQIEVRVRDLVNWLWPNGWRAGQHWPKLRAAVMQVSTYSIPVPTDDGRLYPFVPVVWGAGVPGWWSGRPDLDAKIVLEARFPAGTASGPLIDPDQFNRLAVSNAGQFRAAIAANSLTWKPGRTRVPGSGGKMFWSHDLDQYPVVTRAHRRRLAFGNDTHKRTRAEIDAVWRDLPGVVIADEDAVDQQTGAGGWRIVPETAWEWIKRKREK